MSHAITFDTLAFVKKLEASGIQASQSEAITEAVAEAFENNSETKLLIEKIDAVRLEIKSDIKMELDLLENKFEAKLSKQKSDIIIWGVSLMFAQTAILSIIKFMH